DPPVRPPEVPLRTQSQRVPPLLFVLFKLLRVLIMLLLCLHNQPPLIHLSVRRHEANVQAVMSGVWWKSERKASSSGAVEPQLRPLGSGCRRMTPWEAIAGSGNREKGARSARTRSSA